MNRVRAKELLPIIQAYSEGKDIEVLDHTLAGDSWDYMGDDLNFSSEDLSYRVKPEPEVIYVNKMTGSKPSAYSTARDAMDCIANETEYEYVQKKFIEVQDND